VFEDARAGFAEHLIARFGHPNKPFALLLLAMFVAVRRASFIAREASQTAIRPDGTDRETRTLGL
jgi:hypothetical protein